MLPPFHYPFHYQNSKQVSGSLKLAEMKEKCRKESKEDHHNSNARHCQCDISIKVHSVHQMLSWKSKDNTVYDPFQLKVVSTSSQH